MPNYKIEVHSMGYDDHVKIVNVPSMQVAKQFEREAKVEWTELNDIDLDSNFEMPFTRIVRLPN